jgi:hypothetical protein
MHKLTSIIFLIALNLSAISPVQDFQLAGYENTNFINVLIDDDSYLDKFYCITDNGKVVRIEEMVENPIITEVFSINGQIIEAITHNTNHFLALTNDNNSYLIRTTDFITIDTVYNSSSKILDFVIYDNNLAMLVTDNINLELVKSDFIDNISWNTFEIPTEEQYNRIAMNMDQIILFNYLNEDLSLFCSLDFGKNWEIRYLNSDDYKVFTGIKAHDTLLYVYGKLVDNTNGVGGFTKDFGFTDGTRGFFGLPGDNTILDFEFLKGFNLKKNTNANYQVGFSEDDGEGAYIYYRHFDKRYVFPYSTSLNKIKTNTKVDSLEFVAVGDNGIIVLVNQGLSDIEYDNDELVENNSFEVYPQIAKKNTSIFINSRKIINDLVIYDFTGREVIAANNINQQKYYQGIGNLSTGIYFVKVNNKIQKFLVE